MIQLHCFGESGHSYKVALMLELTQTPWEAIKIDFFGGGTKSPDYLAKNVMGEAPVLIDGDLTLSQSGVILHHLAEKTGQFGGATADDKREILRWILWDNHKMSSQVGTQRFMLNFVPVDKRNPAITDFLGGRIKGAVLTLENALAGRDWLVGNGPTIADLSCCSYLYYPENLGFDPMDFPNIAAWLGRIKSLPGWRAPYDLMPGSPADRG